MEPHCMLHAVSLLLALQVCCLGPGPSRAYTSELNGPAMHERWGVAGCGGQVMRIWCWWC